MSEAFIRDKKNVRYTLAVKVKSRSVIFHAFVQDVVVQPDSFLLTWVGQPAERVKILRTGSSLSSGESWRFHDGDRLDRGGKDG